MLYLYLVITIFLVDLCKELVGGFTGLSTKIFKKNFVSFSERIHDIFRINKDARIYYIDDPETGFIHFNYIDTEHFLDKLNRYKTIEAKNMFNGIKPAPSLRKFLLKLGNCSK